MFRESRSGQCKPWPFGIYLDRTTGESRGGGGGWEVTVRSSPNTPAVRLSVKLIR